MPIGLKTVFWAPSSLARAVLTVERESWEISVSSVMVLPSPEFLKIRRIFFSGEFDVSFFSISFFCA